MSSLVLGLSSAIEAHSIMPIENRPSRSYLQDISNIHLSIQFFEALNPLVPMSYHLQTPYRIAGAYTKFRHMGGAQCQYTFGVWHYPWKTNFKRSKKSSETLVSQCLPSLWHTYVPQDSFFRPYGQRWRRNDIMSPIEVQLVEEFFMWQK